MKHASIASDGAAGTAPLQYALRLAASMPACQARCCRRQLAVAITIGVHAALGVALLNASARAPVAKLPERIEVALIAPPERIAPPPPPPSVQRRTFAPERKPLPAAPLAVPNLDATPIALPRLAPAPLTVPLAAVVTPLELPIAAAPVVTPSPVQSAGPPAPPVEPSVTPPRFDAAYLDNPPPAYPPSARRAREQGRVLLRVSVSAQGRAIDVMIAKTSGSALLDAAAIDAVRRWRFVPARRGDVAVQADVQVPIVFSLTG